MNVKILCILLYILPFSFSQFSNCIQNTDNLMFGSYLISSNRKYKLLQNENSTLCIYKNDVLNWCLTKDENILMYKDILLPSFIKQVNGYILIYNLNFTEGVNYLNYYIGNLSENTTLIMNGNGNLILYNENKYIYSCKNDINPCKVDNYKYMDKCVLYSNRDKKENYINYSYISICSLFLFYIVYKSKVNREKEIRKIRINKVYPFYSSLYLFHISILKFLNDKNLDAFLISLQGFKKGRGLNLINYVNNFELEIKKCKDINILNTLELKKFEDNEENILYNLELIINGIKDLEINTNSNLYNMIDKEVEEMKENIDLLNINHSVFSPNNISPLGSMSDPIHYNIYSDSISLDSISSLDENMSIDTDNTSFIDDYNSV